MRFMILSALVLAALVGFSTTAAAQEPEGVGLPYRLVTAVVIVPDLETDRTNFYLATIDPIDGDEELWDIEVYADNVSGGGGTMLHVNGGFSFGVDFAYQPGEITLATSEGVVTVTQVNFENNTLYLALATSTANERAFIQEVMQELGALGTVQGIVPVLVTPEVGDAPPESTPPTAVANCRALCEAALGPKPADCEGAWDEYICCLWEAAVDICTRKCECQKLPWYLEWPCLAAISLPNGIDLTACVLALPIPGF